MQSLTNQKLNCIAGRVAVSLMVLALAAGCRERVAVEPFDADLDLLFERLHDRLKLMPEVARYKWAHDLPIEDPERERLLVERFVAEAKSRGLDAEWSRHVIVAQITAARRVQQDCFGEWKSSPPDKNEPIRDLQTELRPCIEQLTAELIESLVRLEPHRQTAEFRTVFPSRSDSLITRGAVSEPVRRLAVAPWLETEIRSNSKRLP